MPPTPISFKCPKCKRTGVRQKVNVFVDAPILCSNLSKSGIKSPEVRIEGVGWDLATYYCVNPKCGWRLRLADPPKKPVDKKKSKKVPK